MVFQDPISSLNPRRRVLDAVIEPLAIWGIGTKDGAQGQGRATLESVGIDPDDAGGRRPIEFSGGQCQRISIARALMLEPTVLICDEPVSALDVSVQAQILNLLDDLKRDHGLTMVFIAHDLAVVKNVSDRVAVMYLGKLCEVAPPDDPLPPSRAPLHRGAADLHPRARPRGGRQRQGSAVGRSPLAHQPAVGMPVPHPLPLRPGALRRRGAPDASHRPRPLRGLPLPTRLPPGHGLRPTRRATGTGDSTGTRDPAGPGHRKNIPVGPGAAGMERASPRSPTTRRPPPPASPGRTDERPPLWVDPTS